MKIILIIFVFALSVFPYKYMEITIDKDSVSAEEANYLYKFDLTDSIATIDAVIDSANDIIVCDSGDTSTEYQRYAHYIPGRRCLVYVTAQKIMCSNRKLWVCYDSRFTGVNDTSVFSSAGVQVYIGGDGFSGNTFYDYAGHYNGTGTTVDTAAMVFGVGTRFDVGTDKINLGKVPTLSSATAFTISADMVIDTFISYQVVMSRYAATDRQITINLNLTTFTFKLGITEPAASFTFSGAGIITHVPFQLNIVYDAFGLNNSDKIKIYVNGVGQGLTFVGTFPGISPDVSSVDLLLGSSAGSTYLGALDEFSIRPAAIDENMITDNYRMIYSDFYSVGALTEALLPAITVNTRNDTITSQGAALFSLTATGTTSYQWYRNSATIGASNDTLTYSADSTNDGDSVWCIVTNAGGSVTSDTAFLKWWPIPTIVNVAVEATYLKGSFVVATGKTAAINGTSKTVSAQTDSTAVVVGRLRNNVQDTISLTVGAVSDSVKVKYKYGGRKLTWQTR